MKQEEILVRLEVICGILWLLSDGCWLMEWQSLNFTLGLFAIISAVAIFFYQERTPVPMLVCSADTCWLLMNVLWAVGDMAEPKITSFIFTAKICFFLAITLMACAFWNCSTGKDVFSLVLRRIRLLRIPRLR